MKRVEYFIFRIFQGVIGHIPIRLLYILSNLCAFVVKRIIKYRYKTITKNLQNSFPNKSRKGLSQIKNKFYRNLCGVFLESFKGSSLSTEELFERYKCLNPELANSYFEKRQSIIFALSHYANWEWGVNVAGVTFLHDAISFYKPLSNRFIDKYIHDQRENRGMALYPVHKSKFIFRSEHRMPRAYFLISDQNPSNARKAYWVNFLNQETACLHGIESYAVLFNLPVIYLDIQRVRRGFYTIELKVICDDPQNTKTRRYAQHM